MKSSVNPFRRLVTDEMAAVHYRWFRSQKSRWRDHHHSCSESPHGNLKKNRWEIPSFVEMICVMADSLFLPPPFLIRTPKVEETPTTLHSVFLFRRIRKKMSVLFESRSKLRFFSFMTLPSLSEREAVFLNFSTFFAGLFFFPPPQK